MSEEVTLTFAENYETTLCLSEVRWFNGVLQQKWCVTRHGISDFGRSTHEWRNVPSIQEPAVEHYQLEEGK